MLKDLYSWIGGITDPYGTSPGIAYTPETPTFQPADYQSLSTGDMPVDTSFQGRAAIDWNSPQALGSGAGMDDGALGSGVQFGYRPAEGLHQAPSDIQAQSIKNLAHGGSNIPSQLGSNTPDRTREGLNYGNIANAGLLGATMYAASQGQNQQQAPAKMAPIHAQEWGSTYHPVSFQGAGPFGNASPYTNPTLSKSRNTREELIKRMQYEKGLLG